jgi:hypothetical protein
MGTKLLILLWGGVVALTVSGLFLLSAPQTPSKPTSVAKPEANICAPLDPSGNCQH